MTLVQHTKAFVSFSCSQLKTANVLFILSYFCAVPNTEELAMQPPYGLNLFLQLGTDQRRLRHQSLAHLEARQSPRRSITLSAGINTDQMRREAAQHTPTHDAGGQHTHTRAHGTGAPAAPSHRSVGPSPSLSRAHGTVNPPAECCCSHRQALRTSADAPRARQDDAQSPPPLLRLSPAEPLPDGGGGAPPHRPGGQHRRSSERVCRFTRVPAPR